jgi:predicted permease
VLFRSLDVREPGQLRAFRATVRLGGASKVMGGVDPATLLRIQERASVADFVGFRTLRDVTLESPGAPSGTGIVELVSGNYFAVLGATFLLGRPLDGGDDRGAVASVVISERLWRTDFRSDPALIGRSIRLNGQPAVIVGVVRTFRGLVAESHADAFAPLGAAATIDPSTSATVVGLFARLRPGATEPVAEEQLRGLYGALGRIPPGAQLELDLHDGSRGISEVRGSLERSLWLGLALVGSLLLVACANTAGLLLSRFTQRQTEFGVRAAIGASRGRLARQVLVESMLVAALAAAVGLYCGWLAAPLLFPAVPGGGSQSTFELRFDWRLVAFTIALAVISAGGAAAASLLRLRRMHPSALVSGETRSATTSSRRTSRVLIVAQVACSLLLVVGAVAMWRTLDNLRSVPPGFDAGRTFVVMVNGVGLVDPAAAGAYHAQIHERIASAPGVAKATLVQIGPLTTAATTGTVDVAGFTPASDDERLARMFFVGPHYFETLGMPVIRGRGIEAGDGPARVAVVNERFARFYFRSADGAIGQTVNRDMRIIGVVADAHYNTLRDEPPRAMFVPYQPMRRAAMVHIVRGGGEAAATMRAVREAIAAHDPRLRPSFSTGDELLAASISTERFFAGIAGVLSLLALALACGGLYAAVANGISQRGPELAVRIALGASRRDIITLILSDPLRTALAGIAVGLPASYLVLRSASSLLFGVGPLDPLTLLGCAGALVIAALAAAFGPAHRATRIDPVIAFRSL